MKSIIIRTGILVGSLTMAACANTSESTNQADAGAAEYQQAVTSATMALDKANSVGFEWRDSRKLLKKADAAAEGGDYDKAIKLAAAAELQGERAYQQAHDQANPKPPF